jgi:hypothetical protein
LTHKGGNSYLDPLDDSASPEQVDADVGEQAKAMAIRHVCVDRKPGLFTGTNPSCDLTTRSIDDRVVANPQAKLRLSHSPVDG